MCEHAPAMDIPVVHTARTAAQRLAGEHGTWLADEVEAALYADQRPSRYGDPIALGSLIVSVATLAWTIYQDLRTKTSTPAPQVISRRIRLELSDDSTTPAPQRDRIIDVVVEEVIHAA